MGVGRGSWEEENMRRCEKTIVSWWNYLSWERWKAERQGERERYYSTVCAFTL